MTERKLPSNQFCHLAETNSCEARTGEILFPCAKANFKKTHDIRSLFSIFVPMALPWNFET